MTVDYSSPGYIFWNDVSHSLSLPHIQELGIGGRVREESLFGLQRERERERKKKSHRLFSPCFTLRRSCLSIASYCVCVCYWVLERKDRSDETRTAKVTLATHTYSLSSLLFFTPLLFSLSRFKRLHIDPALLPYDTCPLEQIQLLFLLPRVSMFDKRKSDIGMHAPLFVLDVCFA